MSRQGVAQVAKRWGRGCRSSGDLPLKSVESHLVGKPYRRIDQRETKAIVVSFRLPVSAFEKLAVSAANCPWRRSPQGLARAMVLHYLTSNEEL
jgi:hypothetical protein